MLKTLILLGRNFPIYFFQSQLNSVKARETNIDLLKIYESSYCLDFFNEIIIISAVFVPVITLPTRFSSCDSLIDNIFTNNHTVKLLSGILSSHFSDHQMYFTCFGQNHIKNKHPYR